MLDQSCTPRVALEELDKALGLGASVPARDPCQVVLDQDLKVGRNLDGDDIVRDVGAVDDGGVCIAELDLRADQSHVALARHDVSLDGVRPVVAQGVSRRRHQLLGVASDGNLWCAHDQAFGVDEVLQAFDSGGVCLWNDEREFVVCKDLRWADGAGSFECPNVFDVGGQEGIGRRAVLDLEPQGLAAGEVQRRLGTVLRLVGLGQGREHIAQGGSGVEVDNARPRPASEHQRRTECEARVAGERHVGHRPTVAFARPRPTQWALRTRSVPTMEPNFERASHAEPASSDEPTENRRYAGAVDASWLQGRGAFGGLAIGMALRAMQHGEPRPLRSLTAELPGPLVVGPNEIEVERMRHGRGLTARQATVRQDGKIRLRVSGLFGTARAEELDMPAAKGPTPPPPSEVAPLTGQLPPTFTQHLVYRPTGPMPFSGADDPSAEGWVSFKEPVTRLGAPELVALADAYWPSILATKQRFIAMATISFMLHLTSAAEGLDPAEPLFYRARTETVSSGYLYELRELWTADGRLVALNPQTFSIAPTS